MSGNGIVSKLSALSGALGKRLVTLGRLRLALIAAFSLTLATSASLWAFYLTTHQAISKALPPAQAVFASVARPRYLFSINGVTQPYGVAVTPDGERIYAVDGGGERLVRAFDRDGNLLFTFGPPNTPPGSRLPVYISVDLSGLVYVTDRLRASIDIYDAGGNYRSSIRSPYKEGWMPLGVRAFGDHLLVTEVRKGKDRVLRLSKDGKLLSELGRAGSEPGEFAYPNSATEDSLGRLYVSDGNNARVQVFNRNGAFLQAWETDFSLPRGMDIDGYQRLHVVDTIAQQVIVFDASKDQLEKMFSFGEPGSGDGQFAFPSDIAIDDNDHLYISDRDNNRIQVWVY